VKIKQTLQWIVILGVGVGIGALIVQTDNVTPPRSATPTSTAGQDSPTSGQPPDDSVSADQLAQLAEKLNAAIQTHAALENEIIVLKEALDKLGTRVTALEERPEPAPGQPTTTSVGAEQVDQAQIKLVDQLVAGGFERQRATALKKRLDKLDLERLYLRDQATREGWLDSDRYREALDELQARNQSLREELGEDDYDRLLYAMGQFNRVEVSEVMAGSPAQLAGFASRDVLRAYNGRRIFSWDDLQRELRGGDAGEMVLVDVMRDGRAVQLSIPRGPLGIKLNMKRIAPES
jgi:hypothetical protein